MSDTVNAVDAHVRASAEVAASALLAIYEHANDRLTPSEMGSISIVRSLCHDLADGERSPNVDE